MCHMKLDMLLKETGYDVSKSSKRLSVFLTNSLEEHHKDSHLPFLNWLSTEANEASRIKRDMPIMIALGNPPYSGHSANKGEWIQNLLEVYKKEPGGKVQLQERNPKWLNDDYVKFIRLGEHYIEKNGEGILAYITNHGYLDNPTFRGMRWHLLDAFDDIYILDLHGNSKKKEVTPDGKADKNVFDIMQGVSIIIAIKKRTENKKKPLATVHHAELWGERAKKYETLESGTLESIKFKKISLSAPEYFFIPRDNDILNEYKDGFLVNDLFPASSVGIVTARDTLTLHETRRGLEKTLERFISLSIEDARKEFNLGQDSQDWKVEWAQGDIKETGNNKDNIHPVLYRPFDARWTYYTGNAGGFHCRPRQQVMRNMIVNQNIGLITARSNKTGRNDHFFVTRFISEAKTGESSTQSCLMPLYVYEKSAH